MVVFLMRCSADPTSNGLEKMRNFDVYFRDEKTASVRIDGGRVHVTRYVKHPVKQIFAKDELTKYELGEVLRLRCWEEKRDNIEKYLQKLGLDEYDVYKICEKTHGVRLTDSIWFRFEGETITSKDVLVKT